MPKLLVVNHKVQTDAWLDTRIDMVHFRFKLYLKENDGYIQKRGLVLTMPEMALLEMADGLTCLYKYVSKEDFTEELLDSQQDSERFT